MKDLESNLNPAGPERHQRASASRLPRLRTLSLLPAGVLLVAAATGCYRREDMLVQPKFWKVYRSSSFYADGMSARPLPEGVVPREEVRTDREFYFAKDKDGNLIDHFPANIYTGTYPDGTPYPKDAMALLKRGQQRFNIYCIVCHGQLGYGDGMIVQRGFPSPPSYHSDKLLHHEPVGHFYDVITNGYGAMFGYAERVYPEDRWAITAYIKALQLSQNSDEPAEPPSTRPSIQAPAAHQAPSAQGGAR